MQEWGKASGEEVSLTPSVLKMPAGTLMGIPPSILKEYQQEADKWGNPFNYLFLNYAVTGPSTITKREYTSYIPLIRLGKETLSPQEEPIMMDIVNLTKSLKHQNTFITDRAVNLLKTGTI
ncbi:MAG: hypothetical protein OXM55_00255 [Bdellovibrionales bacterium]|nr:hypothetical protein [Bdellovibrionales bacterium]